MTGYHGAWGVRIAPGVGRPGPPATAPRLRGGDDGCGCVHSGMVVSCSCGTSKNATEGSHYLKQTGKPEAASVPAKMLNNDN